ncbi:hypothetical protein KKA14_19265 [bacterium]|nr:hypothetical protein [bacterium]
MKKETVPGGVLSLTSDQVGDFIAKGFNKFVKGMQRFHRPDKSVGLEILEDDIPIRNRMRRASRSYFRGYGGRHYGKAKMMRMKGHSVIRSSTGHDHDHGHIS